MTQGKHRDPEDYQRVVLGFMVLAFILICVLSCVLSPLEFA